jgi:hypothetical protein
MRLLPRRRLVGLCAVIIALIAAAAARPAAQAPPPFAATIARLSERDGYFDADDNLLTNERSYLHVIPDLQEGRVSGGAYLGVGPDQNFSYIAHTRPKIAIIIDIRRENMLLHLLFKALFSMSPTRVEYLSHLFGRPAPDRPQEWAQADIRRLVSYIDGNEAAPLTIDALRGRVDGVIRTFGVSLSADDYGTIDRFHRRFISEGLALAFETSRPVPAGYYPTYRELLLETDRKGRQWNFLAGESDFQFVRSLEQRDLVVPVVGDVAGPTAMTGIAHLLDARGDRLSAFYVSNVEYYLNGRMKAFVDNLARLPRNDRSVLIRSVFGGFILPQSVRGFSSTSLIQSIDQMLNYWAIGRYRSYNDLLLLQ